MAIREFEFYHGAVLAKILRKDVPYSLKLVETNKESWSTYIINDDIVLYMRYRSPHKTNKHLRWDFSFNSTQIEEIRKYFDYDLRFALVCINKKYKGYNSEVCILNKEQIMNLIDLDATTDQRINVYLEKRKSFRVDGTMSEKYKELIINKSCIDNLKIPG
ncbi:MAG: hypothetical protein KAX49_17785 [Halanaerobiales bacterium]|nr:hypothetical protein [Halanaerobiales bacterium]